MPESVEVIMGIIWIKSVGQVTADDLKGSRNAVKEICQQRGLTKILVDTTELTKVVSLFAWFEHADILAKDEHFTKLKHAIIYSEQTVKELLFLEKSAQRHGAQVRIFPKREDALSWLMS
jgi:hypothetical protein